MSTKTPTEILIDRAFAQRAEIATAQSVLAELTAGILGLGKGKHAGSDPARTVTVVAASPGTPGEVSYALEPSNLDRAKLLSGDLFAEVFDRVVSYVPCPGIENVAPKLFTPARARDILSMLAVQGRGAPAKKAYILWPK
jgi:hypothetical protein